MCDAQCGLLVFLICICILMCIIYVGQKSCVYYELERRNERETITPIETRYMSTKSDNESIYSHDSYEPDLKPEKDKCVPKVKYYENISEIIV